MRLAFMTCEHCGGETLHVGLACCHCDTVFAASWLVPRLADQTGHSLRKCSRRGGVASKLNPRRSKAAG